MTSELNDHINPIIELLETHKGSSEIPDELKDSLEANLKDISSKFPNSNLNECVYMMGNLNIPQVFGKSYEQLDSGKKGYHVTVDDILQKLRSIKET